MFKTILTLCCCNIVLFGAAAPVVRDGDRIAFLGDSITAHGVNMDGGYVNLVIAGLRANGINAEKIPAGVGGNKSNQMLARLDAVLAGKPTLMLLSCGVNDVWHGSRGVPLAEYRKNITAIVERTQSAGVRVCILTATVIRENPEDKFNRNLVAYNDFLRQLAKEKNCLLADLNAEMWRTLAALKAAYPGVKGNLLTYDGVHMMPSGNVVMAKGILRTLGLDDRQLAAAERTWGAKRAPVGMLQITVDEMKAILPRAAARGMSVTEYIQDLIARDGTEPQAPTGGKRRP